MLLHRLSTGDAVYRYDKSIVAILGQPRKVLSTSVYNGGYSEDLTAVFNHDCSPGAGTLRAVNYEEHMRLVAKEIGLDPDTVSGMGTAASMENVSIKSQTYETLTVTALVTGGIEVNGGRVGDPATYFQPVEKSTMHKPGTINILLVIDADMPPGTLARALVTCTEAKTAALQELMAGSNYSNGLATGSGTDQTIVIANTFSPLYLESAGKHSKLGELIGRVTKEAVKEALCLQTGLSPKYQHSMLKRLKRFGVNEETLWQRFTENSTTTLLKPNFLEYLYQTDTEKQLVIYTSLYVHLLDQFIWELLSGEEIMYAGNELLTLAAEKFAAPSSTISKPNLKEFITAWEQMVVHMIKQHIAD